MATQAHSVAESNLPLMGPIEGLHTVEQKSKTMLLELVVTSGDQQKCRSVTGEKLTATIPTLQRAN